MMPSSLSRRHFVSTLAGASLAASLRAATAGKKAPRLLIRSSWQTVNIGDIAHTPGLLRLLEEHLPEAELTLWPMNVGRGVREMLERRFPQVTILPRDKKKVAEAFAHSDFLLHGSGPSLVAERGVRRWHEETGKPFGIYGITFNPDLESLSPDGDESNPTVALMNEAEFVYFRDTKSLAIARELGVRPDHSAFGPDAAFACDLADDAKAEFFLKQHDLTPGKFLCCIPRLRGTPYWEMKDLPMDHERHERNEAMKAADHQPLIEAIQEVIAQTDHKVLLCPEDMSQMKVGKENVYDKLPEKVRERVVWRPDFWLTDEALSTYRRSAGLFGLEMHSPIMCIGNGIPAIVCRFPEQTTKGFMWQNIGLGDWLFNLDHPADHQKIPTAVLSLITERPAALEKTEKARAFTFDCFQGSMGKLRRFLEGV